ncbi:uncharacterized protein EV420DRAFT_1640965 [Desarmillaria tabescens]|uniref:Uncharacterized protein n=1 Tax=Armillaria tabescens TaxID=1929756 RepID=A0AA39KG10_ARMTA|nr:uncharacterized protein EV420DRAFT_1640965 [Desarmillaria tabescens]KAK0460420.1 hypothetical protein EV420DRAFT_1640965 [Desarmillaria tabescens]
MADSLMLDTTTSESPAVTDVDNKRHSPSSSTVPVPSQAMSDGISTVSSSGTSQPRRGFSFRPQPLPTLTPVQLSGKARVVKQSSYQTNRALDDLDTHTADIGLHRKHETPELLLVNRTVPDDSVSINEFSNQLKHVNLRAMSATHLAGKVHGDSRQHQQPEDRKQRLRGTDCSSYNLRVTGIATNDTCPPALPEAILEENVEDATANQKQFDEQRHIFISDRQSAIHKETNLILEKLLALKNGQNSTPIYEDDAYRKAFEEFESTESNVSHLHKASRVGTSATPRRLVDGSKDHEGRGSQSMSGWGRYSDKDVAIGANKSNHGAPATLSTTSDDQTTFTGDKASIGSIRPHIAKKQVSVPDDKIGRETIAPPLQFKRCKAGRAGFHSKSLKSSWPNSPLPNFASSSPSSPRDPWPRFGRHASDAPAAPPRIPGKREHDVTAKGKERYHGHGRSANSEGSRPNASDADSDEPPPPPEQSAMKDFPPEFVRWMSNVNRILERQVPSEPQLSSNSSPVRKVEKKRAGPFKDPISSKIHSPREKWILGEVRRLCWEYLGIENGYDVVFNGIGASPEEVEEYDSGGPTPLANPMRPDWGSLGSRWNLDLGEAFYVQFCKDAENPGNYEFSKNDILVAFENKLKYLRGYVNKAAPLRNETSAQALERFNASLKHRRDISRPTQCRLTLRDIRLEIAGNNMDLGGGRVDARWKSVYTMLNLLGREGISSDKSDGEGGLCMVKRRSWHSDKLTQLLDITNKLYDWKNAYGNAHPGNRPHEWMRHRRATASKRAPIRGLPINFYDRDWYQLLTDVEKRLLRPQREMRLPAFVDN